MSLNPMLRETSSSRVLKPKRHKSNLIPVQLEDIIEAPGELTTSDPWFDLFKDMTKFLTAHECFESGLTLICKASREAVLQNHFVGNERMLYRYLVNWICS